MAFDYNDIQNGRRLIDAIYGRDMRGSNTLKDSSAYTSASKNGQDPATWATGFTSMQGKNDLIDVYGHLRRDGTKASDALWLFLGIATVETNGARYIDAEIYKVPPVYDYQAGFSSGGSDAGHSAWRFNPDGSLAATGDLIVAISYDNGTTPEIDIRIWVHRSTYLNANPAAFSFGSEFDGDGQNATYGYAKILPNVPISLGCGMANLPYGSYNGDIDAAPWGTMAGSNGDFRQDYLPYQFIEIGLDLTTIGVDPGALPGGDPCASAFQAIIFKSRASTSFTAALKDFSGPYHFGGPPVRLSVDASGDSVLTCEKTTTQLMASSLVPNIFYEWSTTDGNIVSDPRAQTITVDRPGTYTLFAAPIEGCSGVTDDLIVTIDTVPPDPVATGGILSKTISSTTLTGGPDDMYYSWFGPGGYTSSEQNPVVSATGTYKLVVTRPRNGCVDSVKVKVSFDSDDDDIGDLLDLDDDNDGIPDWEEVCG